MKNLLLPIILLFLAACTNDESINEECTKKYPNNFFSRVDCFGNLEKEREEERRLEAEKKAKLDAQAAKAAEEHWRNAVAEQERQAAAEKIRPCLALDIVRMEDLIIQTQALITHSSTLEEIQLEISDLVKNQESNNFFNQFEEVKIYPADDDIKKRVLIFKIFSTCIGTEFMLLVNVVADTDGKLLSYGVWASDSPKGYKKGYIDYLAVNYVQERDAENIAEATKLNSAKSPNQVTSDPCAPGLTREQRLDRLKRFGTLRQTSENIFSAGIHQIIFSNSGHIINCR